MLSLAFPWALLLLPLPILIWRFFPPHRETASAIRVPFFRQISQAIGIEATQGAVILTRRKAQMIAAILCWVLIVLGLAQPQRLGEPEVIEKAARDMVLAVDISGSMDARDMQGPDGKPMQRLALVKDVVSDFIEARSGDRISLIVFGTQAFVQAPFTEDLQSVSEMLEGTQVGMAGPHTALGDAIGLAIRTFQTSEVDQRLLVLLSDGADTSSRMSPVNAAEIAAQQGVSIYTIGVGDPEGSGEDRVDLDALEDIATRANGAFYYATDAAGLSEVYAEIDKLNPRVVETTSYQPRLPLAHYPFALALLICLLAVLWLHVTSERRRVT